MPDDGAMVLGTTRRARRIVIVALLAAILVPLEMSGPAGAAPVQWFDFVGGGYGHGVGMSQYGAKGRADAGQWAGGILGFYYPGAAVDGEGAVVHAGEGRRHGLDGADPARRHDGGRRRRRDAGRGSGTRPDDHAQPVGWCGDRRDRRSGPRSTSGPPRTSGSRRTRRSRRRPPVVGTAGGGWSCGRTRWGPSRWSSIR